MQLTSLRTFDFVFKYPSVLEIPEAFEEIFQFIMIYRQAVDCWGGYETVNCTRVCADLEAWD